MLYDSYVNGRTINLGNGTFVFYMSIFFAHFCYPDMAIFDETKVDIISLSTNKKCEKKERLFISVSEQRLFIEYEATKSVSGRWNCRDEKL